MSFPIIEREMYCEHCGTFFTVEGRWVRCSFDDPYDLDFDPDPICPNCCAREAVDAEDAPEDNEPDEQIWLPGGGSYTTR